MARGSHQVAGQQHEEHVQVATGILIEEPNGVVASDIGAEKGTILILEERRRRRRHVEEHAVRHDER